MEKVKPYFKVHLLIFILDNQIPGKILNLPWDISEFSSIFLKSHFKGYVGFYLDYPQTPFKIPDRYTVNYKMWFTLQNINIVSAHKPIKKVQLYNH